MAGPFPCSPENSSHDPAISPAEVSNGKLVGYTLPFIKWSLAGVLDLNGAFRQSIFLEAKGDRELIATFIPLRIRC